VLRSDVVAEVSRRQWDDPNSWQDLYSYNYDGVQLPTLVDDLAVEPRSGRLFVLVGGREIHVLDPGGKPLARFLPARDFADQRFDSLTLGAAGQVYLTDWVKVFETRLPLG
jgi:hypothetical protein